MNGRKGSKCTGWILFAYIILFFLLDINFNWFKIYGGCQSSTWLLSLFSLNLCHLSCLFALTIFNAYQKLAIELFFFLHFIHLKINIIALTRGLEISILKRSYFHVDYLFTNWLVFVLKIFCCTKLPHMTRGKNIYIYCGEYFASPLRYIPND